LIKKRRKLICTPNTYPENNQKHCEIFNSNTDSNNDKDENMNNKNMEIAIEENSILINCIA